MFLFFLFPLDIRIEYLYSFVDSLKIIHDKICSIIFIHFRIKERPVVLCPSAQYGGRHGKIFKKPVAVLQHIPVEERPCCASISVHKGMYIGQPEMEQYAPDDWINKLISIAVGIFTELLH